MNDRQEPDDIKQNIDNRVIKKKTKQKWSNEDKYIALDFKDKENMKHAANIVIVNQLKQKYPDRYNKCNVLNESTLKTWSRRCKGSDREKLKAAKGFRMKQKRYPELRQRILDEIQIRDDMNIYRDIETMQLWALDEACKLAKENDNYTNFRGSRHFIQDIIDEYELLQRSVKGKSDLTASQFITERREWLEPEREFIISNDYADGNYVDIDVVDNVDEVPIVLKGKPRKQVKFVLLIYVTLILIITKNNDYFYIF